MQTLWSIFCRTSGLAIAFRASACFNPEDYGGWDRATEREVGYVCGCFFLISARFWDALGGFDLTFVMYGEETDLCHRARALGARPRITPGGHDRPLRRGLVEAALGQGRAGAEVQGHAGAALPAALAAGAGAVPAADVAAQPQARRAALAADHRQRRRGRGGAPLGRGLGGPRAPGRTASRRGRIPRPTRARPPDAARRPSAGPRDGARRGRPAARRGRPAHLGRRRSRRSSSSGTGFQRRVASIDQMLGFEVRYFTPPFARAWLKPLGYLVQAARTARLVLARRPDVVWVQSPPTFLPHLLLALRPFAGRFRLVVDCHHGALEPPWSRVPGTVWAMNRCDLVLVHNDESRPHAEALGVDPGEDPRARGPAPDARPADARPAGPGAADRDDRPLRADALLVRRRRADPGAARRGAAAARARASSSPAAGARPRRSASCATCPRT